MWWNVLGLDPTASTEQVKKRFRELARTRHPDKSSRPGACAEFQELTAAYEEGLAAAGRPRVASRFVRKARTIDVTLHATLADLYAGATVSAEYSYRKRTGEVGTRVARLGVGRHMRDGYTTLVEGRGHDPSNGRPGDVRLVLRVDPGEYRVRGLDVELDADVPFHDAMAGAPLDFVTPGGASVRGVFPWATGARLAGAALEFEGRGLADGSRDGCLRVHLHLLAPDPGNYVYLGKRRGRSPPPGQAAKRAKFLTS